MTSSFVDHLLYSRRSKVIFFRFVMCPCPFKMSLHVFPLIVLAWASGSRLCAFYSDAVKKAGLFLSCGPHIIHFLNMWRGMVGICVTNTQRLFIKAMPSWNSLARVVVLRNVVIAIFSKMCNNTQKCKNTQNPWLYSFSDGNFRHSAATMLRDNVRLPIIYHVGVLLRKGLWYSPIRQKRAW